VTCRLQGAERVAFGFAAFVYTVPPWSFSFNATATPTVVEPGGRGAWYGCGGQETNHGKPYYNKHEIE